MIHWLTIILGIIILSISLSKPFYNLKINKYINNNFFLHIIIRTFLFIFAIFFIFLGLYIESIY